MKKFVCFIGFLLTLSAFCWAGGSKENQDKKAQVQVPTQQQSTSQDNKSQQQLPTPKPVETPPPQPVSPYWAGDGGKGKSLGILVPKSQGLNKDLEYVPSMVQGILVANISKYSAMSVLDKYIKFCIY
jgi:PBP1b-binding outer membrane lipoprotein LpoB